MGRSFWGWLKYGEEQFDGLYEVMAYRAEQARCGGDVYTRDITENVYSLCKEITTRSDEFAMWMKQLCWLYKNEPYDAMAEQRVLTIWRFCIQVGETVDKNLWLGFDGLEANNQCFED